MYHFVHASPAVLLVVVVDVVVVAVVLVNIDVVLGRDVLADFVVVAMSVLGVLPARWWWGW